MYSILLLKSITDSSYFRELLLNYRLDASDFYSVQLKKVTWPICVWWPIEMCSFALVFISPTKYGTLRTIKMAKSPALIEPG